MQSLPTGHCRWYKHLLPFPGKNLFDAETEIQTYIESKLNFDLGLLQRAKISNNLFKISEIKFPQKFCNAYFSPEIALYTIANTN